MLPLRATPKLRRTTRCRHTLETNLLGSMIVTQVSEPGRALLALVCRRCGQSGNQVALLGQAFLPLLGADRTRRGPPGRIVMISSVAALLANPFMAAYAASKRGLEAFASSLRRELLMYGIDVTVVGARPLPSMLLSISLPCVMCCRAVRPCGPQAPQGPICPEACAPRVVHSVPATGEPYCIWHH